MPRTFHLRTLSIVMLLCVQLMGYEVKMRVVDETGVPVAGAMTKIIFIDHGPETVHVGVSGLDGSFSARGRGTNSVMLKASKDGYYPVRVENLSKDKDHNMEVVMSRILNPLPLYAMRGLHPAFPVQDKWVGFDLEEADWVEPYGKGKVPDILFRFKNEFKGWEKGLERDIDALIAETKRLAVLRKEEWTMESFRMRNGEWDGVMEISFPDDAAGIVEEKRFFQYSLMKMPHLAPTEGYEPTRRYEVRAYHRAAARDDVGFFLRTRVRRDEKGRIVSANYAKIIGDFRVSAAGGNVKFSYYFNPVPNDRNLECAPERNLFAAPMHGGFVFNIEP